MGLLLTSQGFEKKLYQMTRVSLVSSAGVLFPLWVMHRGTAKVSIKREMQL